MRGPAQLLLGKFEDEVQQADDFTETRNLKWLGQVISLLGLASIGVLGYQLLNNGNLVEVREEDPPFSAEAAEWTVNRAFDAIEIGAIGVMGAATVEGVYLTRLAGRREDELIVDFIDEEQ